MKYNSVLGNIFHFELQDILLTNRLCSFAENMLGHEIYNLCRCGISTRWIFH